MKQQDWTEQLRQRLDNHKEPVPEGLWADIEQRMASERGMTPVSVARQVKLRRWVVGVAAALLLLVGLWQGAKLIGEEEKDTQLLAKDSTERVGESMQKAAASKADSLVKSAHAGRAEDGGTITPAAAPREGEVEAQTPVPAQSAETLASEHTSPLLASQSVASAPKGRTEGREVAADEHPFSTPRSRQRSAPLLSFHATNLLAQGGTSEANPILMTPSYMGSLSRALSRKAPVYLANCEERVEHRRPLTVGLQLRLPLCHRWWMATGIDFSRTTSTFTKQVGSFTQSTRQRLYYVGVPLLAGFTFWQAPRLQAYASAGMEGQLNVKADVSEGNLDNDRLQFSFLTSAGLEYRLLPQLDIYVQPGLRYYPDNGSHVQNIFKEKPWQIDLQFGLRYTLR